MSLFTKKQYATLLENGKNREEDHIPVVKLFTPDSQCVWLITEIDPDNPDEMAFGLADLGFGFPELGYIYLPEIYELRGLLGLSVEHDIAFQGKFPISVYAQAARMNQFIVTEESKLLQAKKILDKDRKNTE